MGWLGVLTAVLAAVASASAETFSSTAQLKLLRASEVSMPDVLNEYINSEESRLDTIRSLISNLRADVERATDSRLLFAGHPVNAYNLIKRWYHLHKMAPNLHELPHFQAMVAERGLQIPDETDYIGAAAALIRLQRTYSIDTASLAKGEVLGEKSAQPLGYDDFYLLGDVAMKNNDYGLAAQWFSLASQDPSGQNADVFVQLSRAHRSIGDLEAAVDAMRKAFSLEPTNTTIQSEMSMAFGQWQQLVKEGQEAEVNMTSWQRFLPEWKDKYERLCRGDAVHRPPELVASLTCRYKRGLLPYVVYKEETLSWSPRISMFYDVISDQDAEMIKDLATPLLYRAVVGDPAKAYVTNERVSKVAWLWDTDETRNYRIYRLSQKVKDITGLETQYREALSSSEPFQVVNYGIGGQYEPHVDYYELPLQKRHLAGVPTHLLGTGKRITTFLFYLSRIEHGGATVFPLAGVRVPAVKNAAAFWYNAKPSGEFDPNTQHAGCPVLLGEKWVANKWIREFGQEFRRPCPPDREALWDV